MKTLVERLNDMNNFNPLFQRVCNLANIHLAKMTKKLVEARSAIFPMIGGSVLAEILEREPNPRKAASKSVTKWLLGSYGGNIECWSSPSETKFILITNGLQRRHPLFKTFEMIPVRKIGETWVEFNETIQI